MSRMHDLKNRRSAIVACAAALLAASSWAVGTQSLKDETEDDFKQGERKSTAISSEGVLTIAPALSQIVETGEAIVWDIVQTPRGDLYVSTGHEGKVFHYDARLSTTTLLLDLSEVEATALALGAGNELFVGASPSGLIYRVAGDDSPTTYFKTGQKYVWDLHYDARDKTLYAATGAKAALYAIEGPDKGKALYQSKADNMLSIWPKDRNAFLVATQKPALILEIPKKGKAKALFDGDPYAEARTAIRAKDGCVYTIVNAEKLSPQDRARMMQQAAAAAASGGSPEAAPKPPPKEIPSQIIKINPNGFVQTVWFSPESPIHSLYCDDASGNMYAGVGEKGAVYEIKPNGDSAMALQLDQRSAMTIRTGKDGILLGSAESGMVYSFAREKALSGVYVSRPLDGGDPVRWGALRVRATTPEGTSLTLAMRMGNTGDPDDGTWSEWTKETPLRGGAARASGPPARFLQYRATLHRAGAESPSPSLDTVEAFYLTPNLAPAVKKIAVSPLPSSARGGPQPPSGAPGAPPSAAPPNGSSKVETSPNSNAQAAKIDWAVEEPNNDETEAELFYKAEDETTWKPINEQPVRGGASYRFDTASLPDGDYRVRVVVSDLPSNPPDMAMKAELISDAFTVDNSPPAIESLSAKREATKPGEPARFRIEAAVRDSASIIASAKYSVDGGEWRLAFPTDQIFDSTSERFSIALEIEEPGEHSVALMAVDRGGNTTIRKLVVRIKGPAPKAEE